MCGIIASIAKNRGFNSARRIKQQYEKQKNRGRSGFGFVAYNKKKHKVTWTVTTEEEDIMEELERISDYDYIIFHHRAPTSSPNSVDANHPIKIEDSEKLDYKYFLVHNGHIRNHEELWKKHTEEGWEYSTYAEKSYGGKDSTVYYTYTDSEALGIEAALYIEGKRDKFLPKGNIAFFLLQLDKKNKPLRFYFYGESNPINFYNNQLGMFFSSEGKGEEVKKDETLYCVNLEDFNLYRKKISSDTKTDTVLIGNKAKNLTIYDYENSFNMPTDALTDAELISRAEMLLDYMASEKRNKFILTDLNINLRICENKLSSKLNEFIDATADIESLKNPDSVEIDILFQQCETVKSELQKIVNDAEEVVKEFLNQNSEHNEEPPLI